jgi:hypothetical protein
MRCLTLEESHDWRRANGAPRREWKLQLTCETPLQRLPWFTSVLVEHLRPFSQALLIIDVIVFDVPPGLIAHRRAAGETRPWHEAPGHLIDSEAELRKMMEIAYTEWVDFRVVFAHGKQALHADHDEWTTVHTSSPGRLAALKEALVRGGVGIPEHRERRTSKPP